MRKDHFLITPSGRFHAVVSGQGDALILVHGYSVELNSWRTWERNIDALAGNARVYALDMLGYGESDSPEPRLGPEGQAAALLELLDAEKINRANFIGLSWGGGIVLEVVIRSPQRVNKIVLVDSAFDASKEGLDRLGKIVRPTLIVWDEDDVIIPVHAGHKLANAIPNSRLKVFARAERDKDADPQNRHWTQMTHSSNFNRAVTQFLSEPGE